MYLPTYIYIRTYALTITYLPARLPTKVHYIHVNVSTYVGAYVSSVCTINGGSNIEWTTSQQVGWQMATMGAWVGQVY